MRSAMKRVFPASKKNGVPGLALTSMPCFEEHGPPRVIDGLTAGVYGTGSGLAAEQCPVVTDTPGYLKGKVAVRASRRPTRREL